MKAKTDTRLYDAYRITNIISYFFKSLKGFVLSFFHVSLLVLKTWTYQKIASLLADYKLTFLTSLVPTSLLHQQ